MNVVKLPKDFGHSEDFEGLYRFQDPDNTDGSENR